MPPEGAEDLDPHGGEPRGPKRNQRQRIERVREILGKLVTCRWILRIILISVFDIQYCARGHLDELLVIL